ncbi:iron-sulfur cluster biosynthesis family protein [Paenibacillus senegalensis]|uniref:iron-sulfur cluster biosynthesis family protein n=1 Tax=Paenibacillus senegalensis TaxID=1465766 RepID=UPI000287A3E3|nr:iron-sulfur cluster biosynthesis family protein [Paenibacillus senegalensis]
MHVEVTERAAKQAAAQVGADGVLQLVYDSEGCGCAVSGVPQLWIISSEDADLELLKAADAPVPILYEQRHEVFFEEELKLDYIPEKLSFRLNSKQQIYNNSMSLIDKRK